MASISNNALELITNLLEEETMFESNERFVIIEKFEKAGKSVWVDEFCIRDAIHFCDKDENLHRRNNQPAVVSKKLRAWFVNGKLHRTGDKPALQRAEIYNINENFPLEKYCINGVLHRDFDKPALIFGGSNPRKIWYQNGKVHRANNSPAIICEKMLYYFNEGECYKVKLIWRNKFVTALIEHPVILTSFFVAIFSWLQFWC